MNRRARDRRTEPNQAVGVALGLVLLEDQRAGDRRRYPRRRVDAHSVAETLGSAHDCIVKTHLLGSERERKSAVFSCGCVAVEPASSGGQLQLLQCPTHAELQAKLRRRKTDRH